MHGAWGWSLGLGFVGILFWAAVIVAVLLLIRGHSRNSEQRDSGEAGSKDLLGRRYARSEIDREEFERRKQDPGA